VALSGHEQPAGCCSRAERREEWDLEQQGSSVRKRYTYKLKPTPEQERWLERTLLRCRSLYHAALGERRDADRMCGVSLTYYQRKVSRRKQGSNRRRKAVKLLAKAHQTVTRQRKDFQHKAALQLVRAYDTISHEELQVANLLKNHHLAKSMQDAGWYTFLSILSFKAACAGRSGVAVPPADTSQTCSG
jgi:IS605 OrfB family transposase